MIHATDQCRSFWKRLDARDRARTLAASHFIDFPEHNEDKDWRRRTSSAICEGATLHQPKLASWRSFALALADNDLKSGKFLFARLQSRLMVNMAGGVFENGGLSLDRTSGMVFIPGAAVKGCARRVALAALREWSETGEKPSGETNAMAECLEPFDSRETLLEAIAFIFGWGDQEWKVDSDFAWAWGCDEKPAPGQNQTWEKGRLAVCSSMCKTLRITQQDTGVKKPWKALPNFAGSIAFLPAYPWEADPALELDVITGHHPDYYGRKTDGNGDLVMPVALDTEEPVPVIFPAVSANGQPRFLFLLQPTVRARDRRFAYARRWLANGLDIFGIGAKTNAGYGWFIAEDRMEKTAEAEAARLRAMELLALESTQRELDRVKQAEAEERERKRHAEAALVAELKSAEEAKTAEDWKEDYAKMDDQSFATQAKAFQTMSEPQRHGFLMVLSSPARRPTCKRWRDGKQKEIFKLWQEFAAKLTPLVNL